MEWRKRTVGSLVSPLECHLAHLRHFAKLATGRLLLQERHKLGRRDAQKRAEHIASHVSQALRFYDSATHSDPEVSPVPLYYSYLNMCVAVVEAYRPPQQLHSRSHGLNDRTGDLKKIGLATLVVEAKGGALGAFHSILSDVPLKGMKFSMRDLAVHLPIMHLELFDAFKITPNIISVSPSVFQGAGDQYVPQLQLDVLGGSLMDLQPKIVSAILPVVPRLLKYHHGKGRQRIYRWNQSFSGAEGRSQAETELGQIWLKCSNFGAYPPTAQRGHAWSYMARSPVLPAMTAAMIVAFLSASLARYRPSLLQHFSSSRYNLLLDVFRQESPAMMFGGFRNLLYRECLAFDGFQVA